MNEMTLILYRWRLAKCTIVKRFTFRKVSAKRCNFRVPIYKGVPLTLMKWHPSLTMTAGQVYECVKDSLSEKWVLNYANLGFPFIRGFPSHEWNDTQPLTMAACQVYACEKFHSFNDDSWSSVRMWKVSLSEKCMQIYTTSGFPFIRGFPSHEWNDTHSLSMAAWQVY